MQGSELKNELEINKFLELQGAWYNYYLNNRLITYGEVPELSDEEVEERCRKQYEADVARIRRKYADKRD